MCFLAFAFTGYRWAKVALLGEALKREHIGREGRRKEFANERAALWQQDRSAAALL